MATATTKKPRSTSTAIGHKPKPKTKPKTKPEPKTGKVQPSAASKQPAAKAKVGKPAAPAAKSSAPNKVTTAKVTKSKETASKVTAPTGKQRNHNEPDRSAPPMAEVDKDVLEFITAIDNFKKANGRPFPNWSEVLLVVRQLGYKRS